MLLFFIFIFLTFPAQAQGIPDPYRSTGYDLPRFAAIASGKAFVRAGPGVKYPILWVYEKEGYPVEITLEFENWRKIRGHDGEEGWVHLQLLSGKRSVFIPGDQDINLRQKPEPESAVIAMLKPGVIANLEACKGDYCKVAASGYKGWAERKLLWGVYASEDLN